MVLDDSKNARRRGFAEKGHHLHRTNRVPVMKSPMNLCPMSRKTRLKFQRPAESFLKDVEELLIQKELKRRKRLEKKRKRESGISDVTMTEVEQEAAAPDHRPRKRMRKPVQQTGVDEVETEANTQTPAQSRHTTPQVEKGRNKRLSPASEYLASLLEQSDGRRRSKRQKANSIE